MLTESLNRIVSKGDKINNADELMTAVIYSGTQIIEFSKSFPTRFNVAGSNTDLISSIAILNIHFIILHLKIHNILSR
jgi:hypothetical protein